MSHQLYRFVKIHGDFEPFSNTLKLPGNIGGNLYESQTKNLRFHMSSWEKHDKPIVSALWNQHKNLSPAIKKYTLMSIPL